MGQTLTHGVYLPDEGERNCYNGLAANWQLLDNSVGTIAEHTSALSGKAPLVHTHGNITNDGKVGTTANKPLITGTGGAVQAGSFGNAANTFCEGNDSRLSDARTPVAHTHTKTDIIDLFNSANTWTAKNYFPLTGFYLRGFSSSASVPASNEFSQYSMVDANNSPLMSINSANRTTSVRDLTFRVYANDGSVNGVGVFKDAANNYSFCSMDLNNTIELGTSTNKWKTLNGVNPGALSLPAYDSANSSMLDYDPINTDGWSLTGSGNNVNITEDGYVYISVLCGTDGYVVITEGQYGYPNCFYMATGTHIGGAASAILPVRKGIGITVYCKGTSVYLARFFPAQGNV